MHMLRLVCCRAPTADQLLDDMKRLTLVRGVDKAGQTLVGRFDMDRKCASTGTNSSIVQRLRAQETPQEVKPSADECHIESCHDARPTLEMSVFASSLVPAK